MTRRMSYINLPGISMPGLARDYDAFAIVGGNVARAQQVRDLKPDAPIWYNTSPQGIPDKTVPGWYSAQSVQDSDPAWRVWQAARDNLTAGSDWYMRSAGNTIPMFPGWLLLNCTMEAPRSVAGWSRGLRPMEAVAKAYEHVIADGRWARAYRGHVAFEMGGRCLYSTIPGLPGKTSGVCGIDGGGTLTPSIERAWSPFVRALQAMHLEIMVNAYGTDSPIWGDYAYDAYKLERIGNQLGSRTTMDYVEDLAALEHPSDCVIHVAPKTSYTPEQASRHIRLWTALGMIYGTWIDCSSYDGSGIKYTREQAPKYWEWTEWTDGGLVVVQDGIHRRSFICPDGKIRLLIANPSDTAKHTVPAMDARACETDIDSLIALGPWA